MTQLELNHEQHIPVSQESETFTINVQHELGRLVTKGVEPSPVVGTLGMPDVSNPTSFRKIVHAAITPDRPSSKINSVNVTPDSRAHDYLAPGGLLGYLPRKRAPKTNVDGLVNLERRQRKTTRDSGYHA